MTKKEQELYLKIKRDPSNFMFDMLFEYNKKGGVTPIKNMTLKLMPDGIPMILEGASAGFSNRNPNHDPFESVKTNKSFREISNEIAMETPLGTKSIFYKKEREILVGEIPKR